MLDGRRKSMDPMAERLGVDTQRLRHFMADSPWDYEPVRENLTRWALERIGPRAVVIDDVGFPKDGVDSPGVARMYSGALGKTGNCQIGVSAHLVTDHASSAVNWRLFIPESWDPDKIEDSVQAEAVRERRDRCRMPMGAGHEEKWRLALGMLDQMYGEWGVGADLPVVFDAGYGDCTAFRLALDDRGLSYVAAVSGGLSAYPADVVPELPEYSGQGRRPKPRYRDKPSNLRNLALAAGRANLRRQTIQVRDSKQRGRRPVLEFTREEWKAFIGGVDRGEFDLQGGARADLNPSERGRGGRRVSRPPLLFPALRCQILLSPGRSKSSPVGSFPR